MKFALLCLALCSCAVVGTTSKESLQYAADLSKQTIKILKTDTLVMGTSRKEVGVNSGTGFVVATALQGDKKLSLVMTARHVCVGGPSVTEEAAVLFGARIDSTYEIVNTDGEKFVAEFVVVDKKEDVCLLSVKGVPARTVSLSPADVPIGAELMYAGSPNGVLNKGIVFIARGIASGYEKHAPLDTPKAAPVPRLLASIPIVVGASGGPVFYAGQVVGMFVELSTNGNMSFMVTGSHLHSSLPAAVYAWQLYLEKGPDYLHKVLTKQVKP